MVALVGATGFVGSNIYSAAGNKIDFVYNSKNIESAYGTNPDLLIYAGLRAEKYLANNDSDADMEQIVQAENNIAKINAKKIVLISTIDVFKNPRGVDESTEIDTVNLHAYGYNRYQLELWAREHYHDALIIRLPGLFGKNIKKNFIYDFISVIPFMLKDDKFNELAEKEPMLKRFYDKRSDGFYQVNATSKDRKLLKDIFREVGFSALNFTDSRSVFQFYNLANLWKDINTALEAGITLWHPATEPIDAGELYEYLTGERFVNELEGMPADYDYRTIYTHVYGGKNGYILEKKQVMEQIKSFVLAEGENA